MNKLCIAGVLLLSSTATYAAPTVSGNIISWPDDGWYQVQEVSDQGIVEVCQGGRSCEVSPGNYIVINHSTQERFEDIEVTNDDTPEETVDSITVIGNIISWPDDGWYQVQDALSFAQVCGGTTSCTVDPGSYIVINHTTGQRFEAIEVAGNDLPDTPDSPILVTGNVISWPNDGWYQVQNETDYSEVCGGGSSCTVEPGSYQVINHTTGEKYPNIEVTSSENEPENSNALSDAQMAALPADCLLTTDALATAYCFSAQNRLLISVFPDGEVQWQFQLPGSNESNHPEAIEVINNRLVLITDTTVDLGRSLYEISRFELSGAFVDTLPILQQFQRLRGDFGSIEPVFEPGIALNLDGDDLLVAAGNGDLFVTAEVFNLIPGGDRTTRSDWVFQGSSITKVDVENGDRLAYRLLPDIHLANIELNENEIIVVATDTSEQRFKPSDLSTDSGGSGNLLINSDNLPTLVPYLYQQLQANYVETLRDDLLSIIDSLAIPIEAAEPECIFENPEVPSACFGEITTGPIQHSCGISGSVVETRYGSEQFISGQGQTEIQNRTYQFDGCQVVVSAQDGLADGQYQLSGSFLTNSVEGDIRQGFGSTQFFEFSDLTITYPDASIVQTTSNQTDAITATSSGVIEKDVSISFYQVTSANSAQEVTDLSFHSEVVNSDVLARQVSVSGTMRISGDETSDQVVEMTIEPQLNNLYYATDTVTLSGVIQIDADDGSNVSILAFENPDRPGEELLQYDYVESGELITIITPFESLLIPLFLQ